MKIIMGRTFGQRRVRVGFNPGDDSVVSFIKTKTAELIDLCKELQDSGKDARLASLAMTEFESAAMWAVKCATSDPSKDI